MKKSGSFKLIVIWLFMCIFTASFCISSFAQDIHTCIQDNELIKTPVAEHNGVVITPSEWHVNDYFSTPALDISFLVENGSDETVSVTSRYFYINGQSVDATPDFADDIAPGSSKTLTISISEFHFISQRIKHINSLGASFLIKYKKDGRTYMTLPGFTQTKHPSETALTPLEGTEIYSDENVKVTAESSLKNFPGAYVFNANVVNASGHVISLRTYNIAVNGKVPEIAESLLSSDWILLYPGTSADVYNIIYLKESRDERLPTNRFHNITWKMTYTIYQRNEETGELTPQDTRDTGEMTAQLKNEWS